MASEEIITQDDNPHALIVRAPDQQAAMVLMDRMDLEQAMAELRGEVLEGFVYIPPVKGAKNTLTYAGIKEAARLYRNVHFGATATPLPDGSWMITSYAHNLADNTRCDYPMPYPAFDPRDNKQAIEFRASISKSIRNALAAVLPVAYLNAMIGRWMEEKSGRPQQPQRAPASNGGQRTASVPAAAQQAPQVTAPVPAPAPAAQEAPRGAADLTAQQLGGRVRELAGTPLRGLADWQTLARTYGVPVPATAREMSADWLLSLYQAMQARALEREVVGAPNGPAIDAVMGRALDLRERREITMEQYAALDRQADARYAQLDAPAQQAS